MGFIFVRKSTMDKAVKELEDRIAILEQINKEYERGIHFTKESIDRISDTVDSLVEEKEECRARDEFAYQSLVNIRNNKKATKADMTAAIEEAIGYLGENLED